MFLPFRQGTLCGRPVNGQEFHSLPYSGREVQEVAKLFSKERVFILVGAAASESAVKALSLQDYRIIHIACHGLLDEDHPLRSALVLAQGSDPGNDGLLEMREIYGLSTGADLVVLSACRTARGHLEHAEGPMGLARSFFFTGARSVLASLWSINDRPAAVFMREFYRNLLAGRPAKDALRLAKLALLRSAWSHPYYWATFILIGDPGNEWPVRTGIEVALFLEDPEIYQFGFPDLGLPGKGCDHPIIRRSWSYLTPRVVREPNLSVLKGRAYPNRQERFIKKLQDVMLGGWKLFPTKYDLFRNSKGGSGRHEGDSLVFCPLDFARLPPL